MQFRLGSIPVRIQGYFLLMAALLAADERDPVRMAVWVAVVLISVLVHELGHALVGRAFGFAPAIALHGMGGTTSFTALPGARPLGAFRDVLISLAGPFAGFALGAAIWVARERGVAGDSLVAHQVLSAFYETTIYWGIFNLLPMFPLDGGQVLRSVARKASPRHGARVAHVISLLIAIGIAGQGVMTHQWWRVYLGGLFAFYNVQALRQRG